MSKLTLFCLRAAASRAARKVKRYNRRFYDPTVRPAFNTQLYHHMWQTLKRLAFRAEVLKYNYLDAACEAQRAGLSRLAA